jgi:hypothetical protein
LVLEPRAAAPGDGPGATTAGDGVSGVAWRRECGAGARPDAGLRVRVSAGIIRRVTPPMSLIERRSQVIVGAGVSRGPGGLVGAPPVRFEERLRLGRCGGRATGERALAPDGPRRQNGRGPQVKRSVLRMSGANSDGRGKPADHTLVLEARAAAPEDGSGATTAGDGGAASPSVGSAVLVRGRMRVCECG